MHAYYTEKSHRKNCLSIEIAHNFLRIYDVLYYDTLFLWTGILEHTFWVAVTYLHDVRFYMGNMIVYM